MEKNIKSEIEFFYQILTPLGDLSVILIESDSNDQTLQVLNKVSTTLDNFHYLSLGNLSQKIPNRIERLNYCRNQYLLAIKNNKMMNKADYICIADFDGMNNKLTTKKIKNVLNYKFNWDGIFANQSKNYYDILALRHKYWSPNNAWDEFEWFSKNTNVKNTKQRSVYNRMVKLKQNVGPIEVNSAFGGFAIYKAKTILRYNYSRTAQNEPGDIDHVIINKKIIDGGGALFIDPTLINAKWNIHSFSSLRPIRKFRNLLPKNKILFLSSTLANARNLVLNFLNNGE